MIRRIDIAVASQPFKSWLTNRSPVNFNIKGLTRNEAIQKQKRALLNKQTPQNENVFYNARSQFNNNKNLATQMLRQHRQAYGN